MYCAGLLNRIYEHSVNLYLRVFYYVEEELDIVYSVRRKDEARFDGYFGLPDL